MSDRSTICTSCGRPLRDPRSIESGIGPICAEKVRSNIEPRLFRADYFYEVINGVLVLFDRDCGSTSLTNDMQRALLAVSAELVDRMPEKVIYRDGEGRYDRVKHRKGVFGRFEYIGAESLSEALAKLEETHS